MRHCLGPNTLSQALGLPKHSHCGNITVFPFGASFETVAIDGLLHSEYAAFNHHKVTLLKKLSQILCCVYHATAVLEFHSSWQLETTRQQAINEQHATHRPILPLMFRVFRIPALLEVTPHQLWKQFQNHSRKQEKVCLHESQCQLGKRDGEEITRLAVFGDLLTVLLIVLLSSVHIDKGSLVCEVDDPLFVSVIKTNHVQ